MRDHADKVWQAVTARNDVSRHATSWRRCVQLHGLDPTKPRRPERLEAGAMRDARDRAETLIRAASAEMDRLAATFTRAGCCLVLTDAQGVALERRGTPADDAHFKELGLWEGARWSEADVGVNGIGTAIAEERSVAIYRDAHFFSRNTQLSCAGALIRDHDGATLGVIDFSSCRYDMTEGMLGVLRVAARDAAVRIETALFHEAFAGARVLLTPTDGARPGLIALDRDDIMVGANPVARKWLEAERAAEARQARAPAPEAAEPSAAEDGFDAGERRAVRLALARAKGNVSEAARLLKVSRATLYRKIKRLGVSDHRPS